MENNSIVINNKVICIYSVWSEWYWIDDLEEWKWIYIYENSKKYINWEDKEIKKITKGDVVIFLRTWSQKIFLFTIQDENQIIENHKDKWNSYIIMNNEKEFDISAEQFKNLYFLNFDSLASWVRSPLATKNNVLIFDNQNEIIPEFKSFDKLKDVFNVNNINNYLRKYYFTKNKNDIETYFNKEDYKNIITYIENDKFVKEYSYFYKNWANKNQNINISWDTNLKNFDIDFDELEKTYKPQNRKKLEFIRKNESVYYTTYPSYYDLTRVSQNNENIGDIEENEKEIIKNEIKELEEKIDKTENMEERNQLIKQKEFLEVSLEDIKNNIKIQTHEQYKEVKLNIDTFVKTEIQKLNENSKWYLFFTKKSIENKVNTLLPIIRLSYIYQLWINSWENFKDTQEIIKNFDEILEKSQTREQKQSAFKLLFFFFAIETIILFLVIVFVWLWKLDISDTTLQILTWATILQVWSMLTFVVHHLYPNPKEDKDNKKDENK